MKIKSEQIQKQNGENNLTTTNTFNYQLLREGMNMRKEIKKFALMILAVLMLVENAVPVLAATSKYGEDKPLKTVTKSYYVVTAHGTTHKHWYIDASNGVRYFLYDSCRDGMVGTTPTNHASVVTIDGVKYSLCNYGYKNKGCSYANVIKKISGGNSASSSSTTKKIPLKKIILNKTTMKLNVGSSDKLSVTYSPSNTTDSKTVTWKSSNTSVATVKSGKVTAKKAGTATITAKVGSKTASCKVTVKAASTGGAGTASGGKSSDETYKNVSDAYIILNKFRTTKANQWYWNSNNTSKVTTYGLKGLARNAALEKVAKTRAKEAWTMYYVKGKATHNRPNGTSCFTAYPSGMGYVGENLAWGHTTSTSVITDPTYGWAETKDKYAGQGHRRNMLNSNFTKVGIACYVKDGKTCWAMCLGR